MSFPNHSIGVNHVECKSSSLSSICY